MDSLPGQPILAKLQILPRVTIVFNDCIKITRTTFLFASVVLMWVCSSTGDRARPDAVLSRKIECAPRYNVERAIITVFRGDGFEMEPGSGMRGTFRFIREGDSLGQERFGDWFGSGVFLRAEVTLIEVEFGTHRVSCLLEAGNGENFEITQDGGGRARVLLRRIRKLAGVL